MADEPRRTRRNVLQTAAGLAGTAALAGCSQSEGGSGTPNDTETSGADAATSAGTEQTDAETEASSGGRYAVSMEPVGEVTFEAVPETWVANNGSWADMGVALGRDPPEGVWLPSRYHTQYYDEIPDVSVDKSGMKKLWGSSGVGKEQFYSIDADVHVIDPNFLVNRAKGWKQSDVDEISENVAPFFGNSIFSTGYEWHESYPYLSLYEAFGKLAQAFQRTDRYDAFKTYHDETFQSNVANVVPDEGDRPAVAIMWAAGNEPEEFSPYLIGEGTSFKQWRDLKVRDALAETGVKDFHATRAAIDYETLLEIDPPILMLRGHEGQTKSEFQNTVVDFMENHDVASQLTAVKNGDVYRGGPLYQGPITNLVVTERAAKQVYGVEDELFDRERVASIVNGDF
ncbi:ABC transporter substrate-binding protein [Haloarcula nitratireducens]|uniref:ABC transporter substrate-binding protein n=1 Tax=Haloarcula nitratireducens TaxID=2487749 RepID=A0AAW4PH45_9EURY|nr:ABC transporter substrate-binding protein [Halomicroarcula nitratireducens]MBX0297149.1 ABC transporter substrate-binding protein [Halomicroarcula nitratireducens]